MDRVEVDIYTNFEAKKIMCEKNNYHLQISPLSAIVKRGFDLFLALMGIIFMSPLFLILYIIIKNEDGGDAIFSQERIGYRGKPFILYKFRTMITEAESSGEPQLYTTGDSRLTRVGRFLREHHLDELPQLWNVLKGDMSFVGPRPERKFFIDQIMAINPDYEYLYHLRPGLFSKATLYNGYTSTIEQMLERLRMDLDYLNNRSLWLDIKIFSFTLFSILTGKKF